ncbi:MAG: alpha/beta hydrolase [Nitrospirae bacterium]|nr:alpha/beta hydrolase [Nitrospirota bacterium]
MLKEIRYKEFMVRYRDIGKGEPLVLIHGFCESMEIWDEFVVELSHKYRVITPDLLGHGSTGDPEFPLPQGEGAESIPSPSRGGVGWGWGNSPANTMEMQAECVNEVLKACNVERCTIAGHSMGGYTALAFAEMFPEKVNGLCLFHSSAMADTEEKKIDRDRAIEVIKKDKDAFVEGMIPKMFAAANLEKLKVDVDKILAIAKNITKEGLIAALAGMRDRKDRQHIFDKADYPVLFIIGKDDLLIPYDKMPQQITRPAHSEVLMLAGVGHVGFYEARKETLFAIEKFVEEIKGRG